MQQRIEAIDQYRGIAVILMVIANYLADVTTVPGWLKHAPDVGLTVIDLIAPTPMSARKRRRKCPQAFPIPSRSTRERYDSP